MFTCESLFTYCKKVARKNFPEVEGGGGDVPPSSGGGGVVVHPIPNVLHRSRRVACVFRGAKLIVATDIISIVNKKKVTAVE
jgi:hypothetical protein